MSTWLLQLRIARPLRWALPALALGCGTQGATPLPEPPALDPGKVSAQQYSITTNSWPAPVGVLGADGAAPAEVSVRLTNLDEQGSTIVDNSDAAGAFAITVLASPGDELRLDAVLANGVRTAPIDFIFRDPALTPSQRFACVTVRPGLELPFTGQGSQALVLSNGCSTALSVQSASQRLTLADFTLTTALPLEIAAGESAQLRVEFNPSSTAPRENVLFLVLDDGATTIRYPVTLYER